MIVKAVFCTLMQAAGAMEAAAREMERIGKDAQEQIQRLLQVCPENEGRLLQEAFAACDGLDECGRRMARGYQAFSDHLQDACNTYADISKRIADKEMTASGQ